MLKPAAITIFCLGLFCGCAPPEQAGQATETPVPAGTVRFAARFAIARTDSCTYIYLMGDRKNFDTTSTFILYRDKMPAGKKKDNQHSVKIPCRRIASLSSIYTQMLYELGHLSAVKAIDNIEYVSNPAVLEKYRQAAIPELAKTPDIDAEQTIALDPDIVFTYGMGDGSVADRRLRKAGIPLAVSVDHLEETPLARAEWIRFFAEFVDEADRADSIFTATEIMYTALQQAAARAEHRPSVFCELRFSDAWYMPGGKSYVATLLKDAGADYLWKDNDKTGSLPLSFEEVYLKAGDADYWLNLSTVRNKKELLAYESRYGKFRAFRENRLYNNNKKINAYGYADYWESGILHPERILSDLVNIFHPGLVDSLPQVLYYYRKIE